MHPAHLRSEKGPRMPVILLVRIVPICQTRAAVLRTSADTYSAYTLPVSTCTRKSSPYLGSSAWLCPALSRRSPGRADRARDFTSIGTRISQDVPRPLLRGHLW